MSPKWSSEKSRSGLTLPEALVSSALLGLVLLGTYALLNFAIRWNLKMSESVETYQQAFRTYNRISHDMSTGSQSSFIYDVDGFAFASARPNSGPFQLDSSGKLLYHRYIVYYVEDGTLYRHQVPINPPTSILPPTPDLTTLKTGLNSKGIVMAERFSNLVIEPGSGASIKFRIDGENSRGENSFEIESRMTFRQ